MANTSHDEILEKVRTRVFGDIADATEALNRLVNWPYEPNVFAWHGMRFWFDRERALVIPVANLREPLPPRTLPDTDEYRDLIEVYGGDMRSEASDHILEMFGWFLADTQERHFCTMVAAHTLNLAVVQPMFNPAFASLFWLALGFDSRPPGPVSNLYSIVAPMMRDPSQVSLTSETRQAQIAFLNQIVPSGAPSNAMSMDELAWAAYCAEQLSTHRHFWRLAMSQVYGAALVEANESGEALELE